MPSNGPSERMSETAALPTTGNYTDYYDYLCLHQLLGAQVPRGEPPHGDEMLFIIQHQTTELWLKLIYSELLACLGYLQRDSIDPCLKSLARVRSIQRNLYEQWGVLETLTPSEYVVFRHVLRQGSGLQSFNYRAIEFILGNKQRKMLTMFDPVLEPHRTLTALLESPGLYDEFLMYLHRSGHAIPDYCLERDWSQPYVRQPELVAVLKPIYDHPEQHWRAYAMCEKLVDLQEHFQLWRFRHMKTVERIIGYKRGSGGTSGVSFLKHAVGLYFFPELIDVRTEIGP